MTWSVCSYTNDYLPTHHHHPHSPPGNRNPLVFWHWLQINLKNAEHASPTAPARPLPLHLQHLHLESGWSYFFLKSKCLTLTVNASSRISIACHALGFLNLDGLMHPPIPTGSVCRSLQTLLTPSFLPPPLIPTVSFSGFYWVSELGFSVEVGLCLLQRKGWVCPQAAPPLGQAGWLGLPPHSSHTALYSGPLATLTAPVPVQLHGALGPQEVSPSPSPHSKPMSPLGLRTSDAHLQV